MPGKRAEQALDFEENRKALAAAAYTQKSVKS